MKRLLVLLLVYLMVSLSLITSVQAQTLVAASPAPQPAEMMEQLKAQVLPQLESIFTPAQRDRLESIVAEGETSLRKAFKTIALTPDQKHKLASVLKSLPKKDLFASMTPEQKKEFFTKKKFMPTSEALTEKIKAGMESKGSVIPEGVSEKISEKMKMKETFMPTSEAVTKKIESSMKAIKNQMEE